MKELERKTVLTAEEVAAVSGGMIRPRSLAALLATRVVVYVGGKPAAVVSVFPPPVPVV